MKTYTNKNNPSYIATQRDDGNYKVTVGGKEHYTIKYKKDIEGSEDWVEIKHEAPKWADRYSLFGIDVWPELPTKEQQREKTDGILSVRVGGKKYKIGTPHKNSKIHSFFTNHSDIWVSLESGEQHKL